MNKGAVNHQNKVSNDKPAIVSVTSSKSAKQDCWHWAIVNLKTRFVDQQKGIVNLQKPIMNLQKPITNLQNPIVNLQNPIMNLQNKIASIVNVTNIALAIVNQQKKIADDRQEFDVGICKSAKANCQSAKQDCWGQLIAPLSFSFLLVIANGIHSKTISKVCRKQENVWV